MSEAVDNGSSDATSAEPLPSIPPTDEARASGIVSSSVGSHQQEALATTSVSLAAAAAAAADDEVAAATLIHSTTADEDLPVGQVMAVLYPYHSSQLRDSSSSATRYTSNTIVSRSITGAGTSLENEGVHDGQNFSNNHDVEHDDLFYKRSVMDGESLIDSSSLHPSQTTVPREISGKANRIGSTPASRLSSTSSLSLPTQASTIYNACPDESNASALRHDYADENQASVESLNPRDKKKSTTALETRSSATIDQELLPTAKTRDVSWFQSNRRMVWIAVGVILLLLSTILVAGLCGTGHCRQRRDAPPTNETTLDRIFRQGVLLCGVQAAETEDFQIEGPSLTGFSVDLCKAIAAAVFGAGSARYSIVPVTPMDRFIALNEGRVDVLASATTHTMERHVFEPSTRIGYSFSVPYLYTGLAFGGIPPFGACANNRTTSGACTGMRICVVNASTFARDVPNVFQEEETYVDLVVCQDMASFYRNLKNGACNVLAGDQFEVATRTVRDAGYVSDYQIGNNVFSKEPLALVTRANDSSWSDFVNWVVQSMLTAEEQNITQSDGSSINETFVFGDRFKNMFSNAVTEVGHYGELYESRLQAIVSRKAVNNINSGMTGLLYAMPFGNLESKGPAPGSKSKLEEIRFRGALNCGVEEITGFYTFNTTTETKSGFDVDICWALSAAIFGAAGNMVNFVRTTSTSRFVDLNIHRVDVLSRYTTVNLERDVWEPSANTGFTFSQPTFYDSVGFGGIPPHGECANERNMSLDCADKLWICANKGTTTIKYANKFFPGKVIEMARSELVARGLAEGTCNAIAGGLFEVAEDTVRGAGLNNNTDYEVGADVFTKEPLALVTNDDDPQWSAFVYWTITAIFYAEEMGVTKSTANEKLPLVHLFGENYATMFRDAVSEVGSYKEIYEENIKGIQRTGLNLQNKFSAGAQHYPLPGVATIYD